MVLSLTFTVWDAESMNWVISFSFKSSKNNESGSHMVMLYPNTGKSDIVQIGAYKSLNWARRDEIAWLVITIFSQMV